MRIHTKIISQEKKRLNELTPILKEEIEAGLEYAKDCWGRCNLTINGTREFRSTLCGL